MVLTKFPLIQTHILSDFMCFYFQGPVSAVDYLTKLKQIGLPKKQSEKYFETKRFIFISEVYLNPNGRIISLKCLHSIKSLLKFST